MKLKKEWKNLKIAEKNSQQGPEVWTPKFKAIKQKKNAKYRLVLKSLGDLVTSGSTWGIWQKCGINFNDAHIGIGGSVSSLITCWELYK